MNLNFILFVLIPFILMVIISVSMPFYRIKVMKESGEKIVTLTEKKVKLSYIASIAAFILLFLSALIDFGKLNFVIPYCAVLATFISTKESTFLPVNGVYENLLVNGSDVIRYQDIVEIPEPDGALPDNVIKITTNRGPRQFTFDNANEAHEVIKALRERLLHMTRQ